MPLSFICASCNKTYSVPENKANSRLVCTKCKGELVASGSGNKTGTGTTTPVPPKTKQMSQPMIQQGPSQADIDLALAFLNRDRTIEANNPKGVRKGVPGSSKGTKVLISVVIGLLLVLVGGGAFLLYKFDIFKGKDGELASNKDDKSKDGKAGDKASGKGNEGTVKENNINIADLELDKLIARTKTPEEVYKDLLPCTTFIVTDSGVGSGSLIHTGEKLVLTAYHVIAGRNSANVFFPEMDGNTPNPNTEYYFKNSSRLGINARVIYHNPSLDLALLQLSRLPSRAKIVPLAKASGVPGNRVFTVGSSGVKDKVLWRFSIGDVRQNTKREIQYNGQKVTCKVLETQSPTNPGDSGGPVVNDKGELVGCVSGGSIDSTNVSLQIDIQEIRGFVGRYFHKNGKVWVDPVSTSYGFANYSSKPPSYWLQVLIKGNPGQIEIAKNMLVQLGSKGLEPLKLAILSGQKRVCIDGLDCLGKLEKQAEPLIGEVKSLISSPDEEIRVAAINILPKISNGAKFNFPVLIPLLNEKSQNLANAASAAIVGFGPFEENDAQTFSPLLKNSSPIMRKTACFCLGTIAKPTDKTVDMVLTKYKDQDPEVREAAINASRNFLKQYRAKIIPEVFNIAGEGNPNIFESLDAIFGDLVPFSKQEIEPLAKHLDSKENPNLRVFALFVHSTMDGDLTPYRDNFIKGLEIDNQFLQLPLIQALNKIVQTPPIKLTAALLPLSGSDLPEIHSAVEEFLKKARVTNKEEVIILGRFLTSKNKLATRINALEVLSNASNLDLSPISNELIGCLKDFEVVIKKWALSAIAKAGKNISDLTPPILELTKDADSEIKLFAFQALTRAGKNPDAIAAFFEGIAHADKKISSFCIQAVKNFDPPLGPTDTEVINKLLTSENRVTNGIGISIVIGFGKGGESYAKLIGKFLDDKDLGLRLDAVLALGSCGAAAKEFAPQIISMFKEHKKPDKDQFPAKALAFKTLGKIGALTPALVGEMGDVLTGKVDDKIIGETLNLLGEIGPDAFPALTQMMGLFTNPRWMEKAAEKIALIGPKVVPPLIKNMNFLYIQNSFQVVFGILTVFEHMGPAAKEAAPHIKIIERSSLNKNSEEHRLIVLKARSAFTKMSLAAPK